MRRRTQRQRIGRDRRAGAIEWTVRAIGRAAGVEDVRNTVVAVKGGVPVILGGRRDVREAPAVRRGMPIVSRRGRELPSGEAVRRRYVRVAAGIREALAGLQAGLPKGVSARIV